MACTERPKRSAVFACVKKMNKKISDQKDSINREVRYGMCQSVNFLIRETKTLAR